MLRMPAMGMDTAKVPAKGTVKELMVGVTAITWAATVPERATVITWAVTVREELAGSNLLISRGVDFLFIPLILCLIELIVLNEYGAVI